MRFLSSLAVCLLAGSLQFLPALAADEFTIESVDGLPDDLPDGLKEALSAKGHRLAGEEGPVADFWFARSVTAAEGFQPSLNVKYPFKSGQFMGVLRVARDAELTDFRDQVFEDDQLYVLRYAQQPADGNHIGTSDTFDFLLATLVGEDEEPAPIDSVDKLFELSASASGTNHPAILSLLPPEGLSTDGASLTHDGGRDFWILQTTVGDKKIPLRLIVVGVSEG